MSWLKAMPQAPSLLQRTTPAAGGSPPASTTISLAVRGRLVGLDLDAALGDVAGVDPVGAGAAAQGRHPVDLDPRRARPPAIVEHGGLASNSATSIARVELDAGIGLAHPDDAAGRPAGWS